MHITSKALIALFSFAFAVLATAQEDSTAFSLKDCIAYSLQNHPNSTIYANKQEITAQQNKEALSGYLPQVNATATMDYNIKLQTTVIPAGGFFPQETKIRMGNPFSNNATVQLDQKIYDQSSIVALKARKVNMEIADLNLLKSNESLIYNTTAAYYQVMVLYEQKALLMENRSQYADLVRILNLQLEKGVINKIDRDRAQVNLNNIDSRLEVLETNIGTALNQLKFSMGMPLETQLDIEHDFDVEKQVQLPAEEEFQPEQRYDYQLLERNINLQLIDVKNKKYSFVPSISGYARYGAISYSQEFRNSFDTWYDYSTIGLKLNVPIYSGSRRMSQYKQSQLNLMNMQESAKLSRQQYRVEYENARAKLMSSYNNLAQNRTNLELAKEVYDASNVQYQQGLTSLSDLLNSDYAYKEAQSNYTTSLLNFLSSRLDYEKAKGTLSNYINQF